jgi:hypothetical protein
LRAAPVVSGDPDDVEATPAGTKSSDRLIIGVVRYR